jgi:hypothetical protein
MYKLSEDISKSPFCYEFTKKIGFSNLPRYRSKEAMYRKPPGPLQIDMSMKLKRLIILTTQISQDV